MQIEIQFQLPGTSAISFQQAQQLNELTEMKQKYEKLRETARYLAGKKRGAWGRITQADQKRSEKLELLRLQIKSKEQQFKNVLNK